MTLLRQRGTSNPHNTHNPAQHSLVHSTPYSTPPLTPPSGPNVLQCCDLSAAAFASRHARQKAQQGEVVEAAAVLAQYGASSEPASFELYKHIVGGVLGLSQSEQSKQGEAACRDFLWQLVQPAVGAAAPSEQPVEVRMLKHITGQPVKVCMLRHITEQPVEVGPLRHIAEQPVESACSDMLLSSLWR